MCCTDSCVCDVTETTCRCKQPCEERLKLATQSTKVQSHGYSLQNYSEPVSTRSKRCIVRGKCSPPPAARGLLTLLHGPALHLPLPRKRIMMFFRVLMRAYFPNNRNIRSVQVPPGSRMAPSLVWCPSNEHVSILPAAERPALNFPRSSVDGSDSMAIMIQALRRARYLQLCRRPRTQSCVFSFDNRYLGMKPNYNLAFSGLSLNLQIPPPPSHQRKDKEHVKSCCLRVLSHPMRASLPSLSS